MMDYYGNNIDASGQATSTDYFASQAWRDAVAAKQAFDVAANALAVQGDQAPATAVAQFNAALTVYSRSAETPSQTVLRQAGIVDTREPAVKTLAPPLGVAQPLVIGAPVDPRPTALPGAAPKSNALLGLGAAAAAAWFFGLI